jgi:hypothetical protein
MELLHEFDIPAQRHLNFNNTTSGAVVVLAQTQGGDEIEVTLHPGASFVMRPVGASKLRIFKAASNFPSLLSVDSDEYLQAINASARELKPHDE